VAYYLGIDIGTTYSAAAVWRDGQVSVANLGERAPVIPSVLFIAEDGALLVGEAAERRAPTDPRRTAREFKRRVGDPTPIIVGGTPYSADALMAKLLRWAVDKVVEREGGQPDGIAVSYPANWGAFKQDLLAQEIRLAGLDAAEVATLTEPAAAAVYYASQERVADGAVVAVYDLGGGTFDVAILRKVANGWEILGEPEGIERLGGIDFDEAVFQHVITTLGDEYEALDPEDDATLAALVRLRRECVEAKEALSEDTDVSIPVLLPGIQRDVRLTRSELEEMIRPALTGSIEATKRALRSAKVPTDDVTAVLLVGGSSRVPLVGQLVGAELGRPVAIDVHPKYGIALGAAILAAERASDSGPLTSQITAIPAEVPLGPDADAGAAADEPNAAAAVPVPVAVAAAEEPAGADEDEAAASKDDDGEAFDVAAAGPPVGDGPELPLDPVAAVQDGGPPTEPAAPVDPVEAPATEEHGDPLPVAEASEPPRTVRVPAPVFDEPTVVEPIAARTAEQPAVPIGPRPRSSGRVDGGGTSSGDRRRPPAPNGSGRGRMLLLAAIAAVVVVLAGVLFQLNGDGTDAQTDDTTDSTFQQQTTTTPTTEPETTTSEPETTTSTESTTTTTAPPLVTVPDVSNQTTETAAALLDENGLGVADIVEETSNDVDAGLVIRTDPAAGTDLERGSSVVLVVSSGPDEVTVPPVTELDEATATAELQNVGLGAVVEPSPVDDPALVGIVIAQNPAAGESVAPGSSVTITVGQAPDAP
jgi:actin-like ATPase involved in cell morphogenesis